MVGLIYNYSVLKEKAPAPDFCLSIVLPDSWKKSYWDKDMTIMYGFMHITSTLVLHNRA